MAIETYQELSSLTREELDAYTPEDLESLKTSVAENEAKLADERKVKDEELVKTKEIADNYKIRAEKAEKEAKLGKDKDKEEQLTAKDALAFIEAKVSSEDYDEVIRISKILGKTPAEALKDKTTQAILATRAEERRTANTTQTGRTQRGVSTTTGEDLLAKAESTGEVPEDEEGMKKLFQAKLARKLKR
jgi:hypothetical protein